VILTTAGMSGLPALILAWMVASVVLSGIAARCGWGTVMTLSWLTVVGAMTAYAPMAETGPLTLASDIFVLLGLIAVAAVATFATSRLEATWPNEALVTAAACLVLPTFTRLAYVLFEPSGMAAGESLMIGWMSYSAMACVVAIRLRWKSAAVLSSVVALLAGFAYLATALDNPPSFGADVSLLAALLGCFSLSTFAMGKQGEFASSMQDLVTGAALIALPVYSRLSWLLLTNCGIPTSAALILGWVVLSIASSAICLRLKWSAPTVLSWLCIALSAGTYGAYGLVDDTLKAPLDAFLLVGMLGAIVHASVATGNRSANKAWIYVVAVPLSWALFSRLVVVAMSLTPYQMHLDGALTLAWSLYGTLLMIGGFVYKAKAMRYWSFGVFANTLAKVVIVDMAALDPALRVGVLLVLGLAMLGIGYAYVKNQDAIRTRR
jgi:hypothetical protein